MDRVLDEALTPVWRDVERTSGLALSLRDGFSHPELRGQDVRSPDDMPTVVIEEPDGSATGVYVRFDLPLRERIAYTAGQVQDVIVEARAAAGLPSNWPRCPWHPTTHPLEPVVSDPPAWRCPHSKAPAAAIGALPE
ncbi:MAG TPA: hypothetical protein VI076_05480 [Actinopolymorphaceae bacterium]